VNFDELQKQIEADELADGIEAGQLLLMSVADYAKARDMKPQLIHYYIRKGKIVPVLCECGRKCVEVKEADDFLAGRSKSEGEN